MVDVVNVNINTEYGLLMLLAKSYADQNEPNVLFLIGICGGSAERNSTIPTATALLFPIINFTA